MQKGKIILLFLYLLVARFLCEQKPDQEGPAMQEKLKVGVLQPCSLTACKLQEEVSSKSTGRCSAAKWQRSPLSCCKWGLEGRMWEELFCWYPHSDGQILCDFDYEVTSRKGSRIF